jgi:hypothetical protein
LSGEAWDDKVRRAGREENEEQASFAAGAGAAHSSRREYRRDNHSFRDILTTIPFAGQTSASADLALDSFFSPGMR